jgi:hypothetical protein
MRRFTSSITNPIPVIEHEVQERTNTALYEENSSNDESFHTPSTIGSDSNLWFNDDQVSITIKLDKGNGATVQQAVNNDNILYGPKEETIRASYLQETESDTTIKTCINSCNTMMTYVNPTRAISSPTKAIKLEKIESQ